MKNTATQTRLTRSHLRQAPVPDCFAAATLAVATRTPRTQAERATVTRARRQAARLSMRGEL